MTTATDIDLSEVNLLISALGYDVEEISENIALITTPETKVKIVGVLNVDVLVFSVNLTTYEGSLDDFISKNPSIAREILAGLGDVNAKFIFNEENGKTKINLTEKVKLLAVGEDDKDDIAFALSSLEQDAIFDSRSVLDGIQ